MRRIITILLICAMCLVCLCSCYEIPADVTYTSGQQGDVDSFGDRFVLIYRHHHNDFTIYVDRETRVQYLRDNHDWIVLVDTDGKPLLYEGELK